MERQFMWYSVLRLQPGLPVLQEHQAVPQNQAQIGMSGHVWMATVLLLGRSVYHQMLLM